MLGIEDTLIEIRVQPADALDYVKFWLLPTLSGDANMQGDKFIIRSPDSAQNLEFIFSTSEKNHLCETYGILKRATVNPLCVGCSGRWINAAFASIHQTKPAISGIDQLGNTYLSVQYQDNHTGSQSPTKNSLPTLPAVYDEASWFEALDSPIGVKLKKAMLNLTGDESIL